VAPLNSAAQAQVNAPSFKPSTQVPLFAHGFGIQAFTFTSQRAPVKPVPAQLHENAPAAAPSAHVPRAQGRALQAFASFPQFGPSKPVPAQSQLVPLTPSMQRPPLRHDAAEQSLTLLSQRTPLNPVPEQLQVKAFTPS
jgi:hypothetical protein